MDQLHYPQRVGKDNANPIIPLTVEVRGQDQEELGAAMPGTLPEISSSGKLRKKPPIEPAFLGDDSDAREFWPPYLGGTA